MYFIGVDLGTSAVKILLMSDDGKVVKTLSKSYDVSFPKPGWSEQEPADWWKQSKLGIKEIIEEANIASTSEEVCGISFGGQMHGLVMLDANDEVIRPAILWNDGRSTDEVDYLNNEIGKDKLTKWTGNIAFAGFTAPKVLWVKKNEPENFERIAKIMLPKDYINYMLTGVFATDVSDASGTLYFDVEHRTWSDEMCDICSINKEWLPKIFESYEVTGKVKPELCEELGLSKDCICAAGAGDNAAAAVGMGVVGKGGCNISLGTSGTIFITSQNYGVDENNALHSFGHADGGYHLMGCMLSAASCNSWWMDKILKDTDYKAEQEKINKLGINRVFFLPYLMGERSPINDPEARAAFVGMSMDTKREEMTQAVFEGVAFALRQSLEVANKLGIEITRSGICGGGAKSPLWRQICADILGITLVQTENEEGPALGGAILAAVAAGVYPSVEAACEKIVKQASRTVPIQANVDRYNKRYEEFKMLYPLLYDFYHKD